VYAYRKGAEMAQEARTRGIVGNVQALQGTAASLAEQARSLRDQLDRPAPALEPLSPSPSLAPRRANGA
jgi:hypothetical protein